MHGHSSAAQQARSRDSARRYDSLCSLCLSFLMCCRLASVPRSFYCRVIFGLCTDAMTSLGISSGNSRITFHTLFAQAIKAVKNSPIHPKLHPLLIASGKSARMGAPKHLLQMPDGRPLYQHHVETLHEACPDVSEVYVSLAEDSPKDDVLRLASLISEARNEQDSPLSPSRPTLKIIYDLEVNESKESAGPAAGLLAAFNAYPDHTWLVVACDYPFITTAALAQLRSLYTPPVICFSNTEGFCEPLLGIWSPTALGHLVENCKKGMSGPSRTVRDLGELATTPTRRPERLLFNANTTSDWAAALETLKHD